MPLMKFNPVTGDETPGYQLVPLKPDKWQITSSPSTAGDRTESTIPTPEKPVYNCMMRQATLHINDQMTGGASSSSSRPAPISPTKLSSQRTIEGCETRSAAELRTERIETESLIAEEDQRFEQNRIRLDNARLKWNREMKRHQKWKEVRQQTKMESEQTTSSHQGEASPVYRIMTRYEDIRQKHDQVDTHFSPEMEATLFAELPQQNVPTPDRFWKTTQPEMTVLMGQPWANLNRLKLPHSQIPVQERVKMAEKELFQTARKIHHTRQHRRLSEAKQRQKEAEDELSQANLANVRERVRHHDEMKRQRDKMEFQSQIRTRSQKLDQKVVETSEIRCQRKDLSPINLNGDGWHCQSFSSSDENDKNPSTSTKKNAKASRVFNV
jgi:hypothetical protein